jgi:hypothetical protein
VLDKLAAVQMLDVHFPTTDGRTLVLTRYTELNPDQKLLLKQLNLNLPPQPAPRLTAPGKLDRAPAPAMWPRGSGKNTIVNGNPRQAFWADLAQIKGSSQVQIDCPDPNLEHRQSDDNSATL